MKGICQADILALDKELQSKGIYGEKESEVARFCLACILVGAKKRTVKILSQPIRKGKFEKYWENLQSNHYFTSNKKIDVESTDTVPFLLMAHCAQGIIERKEAKA